MHVCDTKHLLNLSTSFFHIIIEKEVFYNQVEFQILYMQYVNPNSICKKGKSQSKIPFLVHITFMFCGRPLLNKSSVRSTFFIPVIPSTLSTPPTALSTSSSSVDKPLSEHPSLTPLSVSVLLGESPFRLASSSAPFLGQ